ncbi:MAG: flagellar hook-associated protein FlgK [Zoogloeaceae bacterium]|nr:flagellar hook-associated protein FlgK [Zoogloeaceae bacterium]MCK6385570.1 flagellar hook-associated protein FlgK [Rhodocyclaceae bacterium]
MGTSIFNIGVSGLAAAQAGLLTTGHNISNASTPGFNRQQIVQGTSTPQFTGSGFLGQGTSVMTVRRIYSQFLAGQTLAAQTRLSELNAYADQLRQIDGLLADSSAGLSSALNDFFRGVHEVAAYPASIPARQSMLSMAQALSGRFQSVNGRIEEIREGVDTQLASTVTDINSFATQIAQLNQRIILAQAAGPGQPANDLHDQRDQLVAELNQKVRVTTMTESDGSLSVFVGNGQAMVVGVQSFGLAVGPSGADASRMTVGITLPGGGTAAMPESMLSGGTLGGLLSFRSESLDAAQNALGRIALGLAETFNAQHRLGQDLSGAIGGNFFSAPAPQVIYPNNPANGGTAVIGVALAGASALTTSDYTLTANGGGNYTLTRLSDNATLFAAAALPQTVDGLAISLAAGAANAGDSFLIQPTRAAAGGIAVALTDARSIAAAAPIRTEGSIGNTGTGSISAGSVNGPPPVNANLTQTVTITFDNPPTSFDVAGTGTGNPSNVAFTAGGSITYNGWTIQISGTPAAGDVFTISASTGGVSDNRNALLLAGLQAGKLLAGGTASYQSAYSQIVSDVGNKAREVQVSATAQESILQQAESAQQSLSGVNLDEEAANLLRYQQAYQASGKMIEVASKLFDTLLQLGR